MIKQLKSVVQWELLCHDDVTKHWEAGYATAKDIIASAVIKVTGEISVAVSH